MLQMRFSGPRFFYAQYHLWIECKLTIRSYLKTKFKDKSKNVFISDAPDFPASHRECRSDNICTFQMLCHVEVRNFQLSSPALTSIPIAFWICNMVQHHECLQEETAGRTAWLCPFVVSMQLIPWPAKDRVLEEGLFGKGQALSIKHSNAEAIMWYRYKCIVLHLQPALWGQI